MYLPKIKFIDMPISEEASMIFWFLTQDTWGWNKHIIKAHPAIKEMFLLKSEKDQKDFLKKFIIAFRKGNVAKIRKNRAKYEKAWRKIEKDFFMTLSEILEIEWSKDRKVIYAMSSINPVCPRFLDSWSFSMFYDYKRIDSASNVIMHECCHFLYFEKWKKIYPNMVHKKFDAPHVEWHLSEIVAPIILNDKRIQRLLKRKSSFYPDHEKIRIGKISAPRYFTDLYKKDIRENKGMETFLKEAYQEIKRNKNLFKT